MTNDKALFRIQNATHVCVNFCFRHSPFVCRCVGFFDAASRCKSPVFYISVHLKVSKAVEHWHSAQAAAALSKHHFLSEFFLRSAGDHLHQLRPAASSHIFYLFQSSVLLHLHFYTFGKDFPPLLPILVTIFLTNQWWLHSTEVFVSFLLNSKSPFLPGWFPLFLRLCKWTRLPHGSWGRKKSPKRNQLAGWVMVNLWQTRYLGNLVEILFSLLKLFTVVKGSNLGVGGRWRRGPYR